MKKKPGESGYLAEYGISLNLVETMDDVAKFLEWIRGPRDGLLCFDTETTGLRPDFDTIRLAQMGDRSQGWAIPYERWGGLIDQVMDELDEDLGLHNCFQGSEEFIEKTLGATTFQEALGRDVEVWTGVGWQKTTVESYGKGRLFEVVLKPGSNKSRTALRRSIISTGNHRWVTATGEKTTNELKHKDIIPFSVPDMGESLEGFIHGLVFADGGLSTHQPKSGKVKHQIRLCGGKSKYVELFERVTYPPSYGGDPMAYVTSDISYKELPGAEKTGDYLASFIRGWVEFDGTNLPKEGRSLSTVSLAASKWLELNAWYAGYQATGSSRHSLGDNQYSASPYIYMVNLHKENTLWAVQEVIDLKKEEEVFCVEVPQDQFTLAGGVLTRNSKFDARHYVHMNPDFVWPWDRTHDTMSALHLFDPLRPKGLKPAASRLIDPQAGSGQNDLDKAMTKQKWTWATVPVDLPAYWQYGALDPVLTSHIASVVLPKIQADEQLKYLYDLEMGVTRVVSKMETRGIEVDPAYLEQKYQMLTDYINEAKAWLADSYGVTDPTPMKLMRFFEDNEIPFLDKRTKGGSKSMDKEVMDSIKHPVARTVLSIRKADKLAGTYLKAFLELRDENNRVHCNFWTLGTRTGRMSITNPALQTLPKKDTTVRSAVVPTDGYALVSFDADQIEARLMAHFSGSEPMIEAFRRTDGNGGDFFCEIASVIYGEEITDKKDPRRQMTKTTIYALIYGGGAETIAHNAGVEIEVMYKFLFDFDQLFPEVKNLQKMLNNLSTKRFKIEGAGYVKTPLGRRLIVDDQKEYTATNYLIQAHAAEILKEKVVLLDTVLPDDCHILLLVHDEILFEVPEAQVAEIMETVHELLNEQPPGRFKVPLTWGGEFSLNSWGDLVD